MNLSTIIQSLRRDFPQLRLSVKEHADHVWIYNIEVDSDFQNMGIGSAVIARLKQCGQTLRLFPRAIEGRQYDLLRFYFRHGFTINKCGQMEWKKV